MPFAKDTIKLGAARKVFDGVEIQEITIAGKVAGYKATFKDVAIENTSLTALCAELWKQVSNG